MAKKPVAKRQVKKTPGQTRKKTVAGKSKPGAKKASSKNSGNKKALSEKERELRAANLIANSERKTKSTGKRPKKNATGKQTLSLVEAVVEGIREKKGRNITVLNLKDIDNRVTDFFVIADAESSIHVNSIADGVEETVIKLTGEKPYHSEGKQNNEWILVDYINVVAHIFRRDMREHYNIEGLWGDAEITHPGD